MARDGDRQQILGFLGTVLEPVIRLMLRMGITWKEFADLAKTKFVEVATADFSVRGRPTNASRVAILTGLDRREVSRLRSAVTAAEPVGYHSKPSQILFAWHHEKDFLDAAGEPAVLPVEGDGASFAELMRRHAPALPHVAMIKELRNAEAVEQLPDGRLRALTRVYVPRGLPKERLRLWASVLSDVANTIEHNFARSPEMPSRFERRAVSLKVDRRALPEFRKLLEAEGQALLERIDDWLSAHEVSEDSADAMRLGVGVYHIEDRNPRRTRT
ncbi:MAG TPA: DUF6502 family protein [Gammaproteobacteria bacterium]|jgi:hypothetical protein|nr:DUF6502 family protein [Gammaproteobacteria bacterium]